jgi:NifB/MoaA-like Fe-S oxidoreductase
MNDEYVYEKLRAVTAERDKFHRQVQLLVAIPDLIETQFDEKDEIMDELRGMIALIVPADNRIEAW